jgi:hypothetical protein
MLLPVRSAYLLLVGVSLSAILSALTAGAQAFSTTGGLALPVVCQTATRLQDGTVLIAGGFESSGSAAKAAEIYDPAGQSSTPTGSLNVPRTCGGTTALLNDGTVLVVGGGTGSGNTTAELYDPPTRTFILHTPPNPINPQGLTIGPMTTIRQNPTETVLQDGTVLIVGGNPGGLKTAEIYNPATGTFSATAGMMSTPRQNHSATLLADGTVLIAGGDGNVGNGETAWNTAEIYHPSTRTFTLVGQMTTPQSQHTATLLADGTVLLVGGLNNNTVQSSAEIYTPATKTFAATGSMGSARFEHAAVRLADGTVLVTGGANASSVLASAEVYSPSTKTFSSTGNMTTPRALHTATILSDGQILTTGGENSSNGGTSSSSAELYSYPVTTATMNPAYKVTSIIYAPPGNKSQTGFTSAMSSGTTTSIGSSFAQGFSVTMGIGFKSPGVGVTASQTFGMSSTSSNSSAFQESFTNATGVTNQSNSAAVDAINHSNDFFLVWLNPQITVFGNASTPVGYNMGVQPLADGTTPLPDIVPVFASAMEANSAGVTTVPPAILNQSSALMLPGQSVQLVPGLASICKNLNKAEYAAQTCGMEDQCGCTSSDFLPILQNDPLLFSNGLKNPISPLSGVASPLVANISSAEVCGSLPVTPGSDCRYVPVPSEPGSTQQQGLSLVGPEDSGGDSSGTMFSMAENTQETIMLGGQSQTTVSQSVGVTLGGTGSSGSSGTFGLGHTMTWTDSQSVGSASGEVSTLSATLATSTVGCAERNNIGVFEDTLYHTFVFQQPSNPSGCTTLPPAFAITTTPSNPAQTALSLGHSINYTVSASALNGFSGTVALSASGLPNGVTASFSPASITTSSLGSATLTLTAAYRNTTFIGNFTVTVTGTSGSLADSALLSLATQPLQYKGACGVQ